MSFAQYVYMYIDLESCYCSCALEINHHWLFVLVLLTSARWGWILLLVSESCSLFSLSLSLCPPLPLPLPPLPPLPHFPPSLLRCMALHLAKLCVIVLEYQLLLVSVVGLCCVHHLLWSTCTCTIKTENLAGNSIWQFGSLCLQPQVKISYFSVNMIVYMCMTIPYHAAKFKSAAT